MTNVFALLRPLPMSNGDKDAEILALRHQLSVLQRQLGPDRARFAPGDRALLAALLHRLPREVLKRLPLMVHPDTVLRWHRDLVARRARPAVPAPAPGPAAHRALDSLPGVAAGPRKSRLGVPPGARRAVGARGKGRRFHLWEILHDTGIDPAPERSSTTWAVSCAQVTAPRRCGPIRVAGICLPRSLASTRLHRSRRYTWKRSRSGRQGSPPFAFPCRSWHLCGTRARSRADGPSSPGCVTCSPGPGPGSGWPASAGTRASARPALRPSSRTPPTLGGRLC